MNQIIIKQTAILSAILGGIIGVVTLIPFIRGISFLILILCISAIVIVYMKKNELIGIIDIKEGAILGAIIGFVSFVAFSIVFIPLAALTGLIFKDFHNYWILEMLKAGFGGVILIIVIVISVSLTLSAPINAFVGLATAYVYEILSGIKKESNENIDFEIKE